MNFNKKINFYYSKFINQHSKAFRGLHKNHIINKQQNKLIFDEFLLSQLQFYQHMADLITPQPPSHKTWQFGAITIDSNFDSGNLFNAQKISANSFNIWIAVDHPKHQYRTWFHFSILGLHKGTIATFNLKNMQNQSKLLNEGLVPVYREQNSKDWKKIAHKIDLGKIEYNEGWIQWSFKHTMTSDDKVFFAFFYPWSNAQNDNFLRDIQEKCNGQKDIYFKRSNIISSLEGRPVDFVTISSTKFISNKNENFDDQHIFSNGGEPKQFGMQKKCIIISARVHPGEVPSSHVMTGIINELTQDSEKGRLLRDKFVFYLFPILNPDGVFRGHYRVDPNGINLNRCYINPSPKNHSPIYAIKKVIIHFHTKGKYFGFLDLHAHAARKGVFIYGNSTNQLQKQVEICLFPKILSMNSQIFEYQGSNFTQKNMYCKDINDHVSKEGAGRVALFKATKNPYSWTLQCNYNTSRVINILEVQRKSDQIFVKSSQKQLDIDLITTYKAPSFKQPKQFYTIDHFHKLGKQICFSFLDLAQINPQSRIDNAKSYFKSVQNLKLNLAVSLLRMAPNRFQSHFKKIYHCIEGQSATKQLTQRGVKALYYMLIKNAKIENISAFLKENDQSSVVFPNLKIPKKMSLSPVRQLNSPQRTLRLTKSNGVKQQKLQLEVLQSQVFVSKKSMNLDKKQFLSPLKLKKVQYSQKYIDSDQSEKEELANQFQRLPNIMNFNEKQSEKEKIQAAKLSIVLNSQLLQVTFHSDYQRILGKQSSPQLQNLRAYRKSFNSLVQKNEKNIKQEQKTIDMSKKATKELPSIVASKIQKKFTISSLANDLKLLRKGNSLKDRSIFYFPSD